MKTGDKVRILDGADIGHNVGDVGVIIGKSINQHIYDWAIAVHNSTSGDVIEGHYLSSELELVNLGK